MFRCQALSKRSKQQSKKAASNGKRVCKLHGGKSTGPGNIQWQATLRDGKNYQWEKN